jgi:hypothetical protein
LYVWKALPKLTLFQAIFRDILPLHKLSKILKDNFLTLIILYENIKLLDTSYSFRDLLRYFDMRNFLYDVSDEEILLEKYKKIYNI